MNGLNLIGHYKKILNELGNHGACVDASETQPSLVNIPFHIHFGGQGQLSPVMDTPACERSSGT